MSSRDKIADVDVGMIGPRETPDSQVRNHARRRHRGESNIEYRVGRNTSRSGVPAKLAEAVAGHGFGVTVRKTNDD